MKYNHIDVARDCQDFKFETKGPKLVRVKGIASYRKRVGQLADRFLALLALIILAPVLLLFAAALALCGEDPIFKQSRVGYLGRDFNILKFRTIPEGGWDHAAARAATSWRLRWQLALFRQISMMMRATGLDELPQFLNILRGDMRLIGPRPLTREDFMAFPPHRFARCAVPPGITGLAQVNGGQALDPESKLALDIYYIEHASMRLVAEIFVRSFCRVTGLTAAVAHTSESHLAKAMEHLAKRLAHDKNDDGGSGAIIVSRDASSKYVVA